MSAQPERASSRAPCACTNISLMQLFHELKQKFPEVPDHVVSSTIALYCHDKLACETHLHSEAKASLTHAYHASSSAAARQLNELKLNTPQKCPNQTIIKHEVQGLNAVHSITCENPQVATLSKIELLEGDKKVRTDANQNVVELSDEGIVEDTSLTDNLPSPVAVINIDNCLAKYNTQSPSDPDLPTETVAEQESKVQEPLEPEASHSEPESINYRILKSNKIKSNLNERLEKNKQKKVIQKEQTKADQPEAPETEPPTEKPKRPNTLEFLKPTPDIAFKESFEQPKPDCKSVSPAHKPETQTTPGSYWPGAYPLNLSVNVNCHMDYGRGFDPWLEDYSSPRAITSVNLTVCTPTSNMASPVRDEDSGFEGHVTVTVSPSAPRPPWRRAPAPPVEPRPAAARGVVEATNEPTLIARQKERLAKLAAALAQERGRVARLTRETQVLAGRPPSPAAAGRLRDYVTRLREQCNTLAKRLEVVGNDAEPADFYSNIYTGQRAPARAAPGPPGPWQCHVCTFRNHPLLDKCEECEMPRIVVVRGHEGITVRVVPGRRSKYIHIS